MQYSSAATADLLTSVKTEVASVPGPWLLSVFLLAEKRGRSLFGTGLLKCQINMCHGVGRQINVIMIMSIVNHGSSLWKEGFFV